MAAVVAAVLGSVLNDSGAIVGGVTVLVVTASLAYMVVDRRLVPDGEPPPAGAPVEAPEQAPSATTESTEARVKEPV